MHCGRSDRLIQLDEVQRIARLLHDPAYGLQRPPPPSLEAAGITYRAPVDARKSPFAASSFDAFIFFKAEAVRYITDFYVKGYRPFMEPEYFVLVLKGKPPVVGYISGSDDIRIRIKSDIADARKLPPVAQWATVISQMLTDYGLTQCRLG